MHLLSVRPVDGMRAILHGDQARPLDHLRRAASRRLDRHNTICIAVDNERRDIDARQVLTTILMPRWHTRHTRDGGSPGSDMPTGLDRLLADALPQKHIGVEEILEELREKRVP